MRVTSRQQLMLIFMHSGITLSVVIVTFVLAILHDISDQAVTALIGTAIGFAGGAGSSRSTALIAETNGRPE